MPVTISSVRAPANSELPEKIFRVPVEKEVVETVNTPVPPPWHGKAQLTEAEMDALYEAAGVPEAWRADLKAIAKCESRWSPGAVGDGGNSLGLHQLWTGWSTEDLLDPVVNTRVAVRVRETRGKYGGGGGWSCAGLIGIE